MKRILVFLSALVFVFSLTGCSAFMEGFREGLAAESGVSETPAAVSAERSPSRERLSAGSDAGETQLIRSAESSLSLVFPGSWVEMEGRDRNEFASIQMGQRLGDQYLLVIEEPTSDFDDDFTLFEYAYLILDEMTYLVNPTDTPLIEDVEIGDSIHAKQFELTGSVDRIRVRYLVTVVEYNDIFYQLVAWSTPSRYDTAKPIFMEILNSVTF